MTDPTLLSVARLGADFAAGHLDPGEVIAAHRARIERHAGRLRAFTALTNEPVRDRGPLAGIPVAVKDAFVDGGRAPTMGSRVHAPGMQGTAAILERLRAAGATVIGYTNLHEWAIGTTSTITADGPVLNPWDEARMAGGSSGGSAVAVAAGLASAAIGTDAGGSVRIPAASCGIVGLKPTYGALPLDGEVGAADPVNHVGLMARSVRDTELLFSLLGGRTGDPDVRSLVLGIPKSYFFDNIRADMGAVVGRAVELIGAAVRSTREVDVTGLEASPYAVSSAVLGHAAMSAGEAIDRRPEDFAPRTLKGLLRGREVDVEVDLAPFRATWERVFRGCDVVAVPTLPAVPPPIEQHKIDLPKGEAVVDIAQSELNAPMNTGGVPALAVPCGEIDGMPVSVTLVAPWNREADLFAAGRALEDATDRAFRGRIAID